MYNFTVSERVFEGSMKLSRSAALIGLCCFFLGAHSASAQNPTSFESVNFPGHYIRHAHWLGELTRVGSGLDKADATFVLVKGATPGSVSFASVNAPGYYLRHQQGRLKLQPFDPAPLYRLDSSFILRPGLGDGSANSFSYESVNYPGSFIRHRGWHLWVERNDGSDLFRKDATFRLVPGLASPQDIASPLLQNAFNASRGKLEAELKSFLSRGDLLAKGFTLYNINLRLGTADFRFTSPTTFTYNINGNHMYFKSTQPTDAGSYADPALELNFNLAMNGSIVPGPKPRVQNVVASVPWLEIKGRNVVGDAAVTLVNIFRSTPKGRECIQKAADQYLRRDITDLINSQLQ